MGSKYYSSRSLLLCVAVAFMAGSGWAQSNNTQVFQNSSPNFYVITPQTGEQKAVGQTAAQPSTASGSQYNGNTYNTYVQPSPASTSAQRATSTGGRTQSYQTSQRQSGTWASNTRQTSQVNTSAQAQGYSVQNASYSSTQPDPTYASASSTHQQGLLHRIFHKGSDKKTAPTVQTVSASPLKSSRLDGTSQAGTASWYGTDFHGGKTANGERYNMESMTAAHKTLPFGTMVRVRNERNGRECTVRINNRGPFIKGRILDVSKAAARELGMIGSGVAKVSMKVIGRS